MIVSIGAGVFHKNGGRSMIHFQIMKDLETTNHSNERCKERLRHFQILMWKNFSGFQRVLIQSVVVIVGTAAAGASPHFAPPLPRKLTIHLATGALYTPDFRNGRQDDHNSQCSSAYDSSRFRETKKETHSELDRGGQSYPPWVWEVPPGGLWRSLDGW